MGNPGHDPAKLREALALVASHGTVAEAAAAAGIPYSTLEKRYKKAQRDPAIQAAMDAIGTNAAPHSFWTKVPPKDGVPGHSVYMQPDRETAPEFLARIAEAMNNVRPVAPVQPPDNANADLLTIYPIADAHIGMLAYGRETGESYNTDLAVDRVTQWVARAVDASPPSGVAVILDVGDLTHADDDTNQTPRSKHALTVDSRHFRTLDVTIGALAAAVDYALQKHARVIVRILPGNHNQTSYMAVMFALFERYRNEPRVEVQKVPGEFFVMQFGQVMLAAHHGHGGKPDRMVHFIADEYAEIWGGTRHRFLWTGHLHHLKAQDIGGMTHEQLRAITARDAYAIGHAYSARAQLQAITLHKTKGEVQRVKIGAAA